MQAFQVSFLDVQVFIKNSLAAKKSAGLLVCWSVVSSNTWNEVCGEKSELSCILVDCTALCLFQSTRIVIWDVTNKCLFETISTTLQFLLDNKNEMGRNDNYCW